MGDKFAAMWLRQVQNVRLLHMEVLKDGEVQEMCLYCSRIAQNPVPYPCDTIQVMNSAIRDVKEERENG
jgi:hypothetical protein